MRVKTQIQLKGRFWVDFALHLGPEQDCGQFALGELQEEI